MEGPSPAGAAMLRIIVPFHSESTLIGPCLDHVIAASQGLDAEIVVVDDSPNGTDLDTLLTPRPVTVRSTGGAGSAAAARNCGARDFAGSFLVFIDTDVFVEPDAIRALVATLEANPADPADAAVGNYSRDVEGLPFASQFKQLYISTIYARPRRSARVDFWTALSAVRAEAFHAMGGFNLSYKGACGEDTEFGNRLTDAGYTILAAPQARGKHMKVFTVRKLLLNDWRKGLVSIRNGIEPPATATSRGKYRTAVPVRRKHAIHDNPHAAYRDMGAALAGSLTWIAALATILDQAQTPYPALAACGFALAYLALRGDILRTYASRGIGFLLRALPLLFTLDQVRVGCAIVGLGQAAIAHARRAHARRAGVPRSSPTPAQHRQEVTP